MCFSPTCPITSNKMTIYCCKWHPTAFLKIFQTCSHPPDLFQSPYDISTRTGKPSYHLGVSSRYPGEEPKQSMWAPSTRISSTAHLYVGVLLAFQFYRDVLRKKREHLRQSVSYTGLIHSPSSPPTQESLAPQTREDCLLPIRFNQHYLQQPCKGP